ncbi:MAG: DUF1501 domain-containing protein [Planctomycetaceae bacterium]|nr:DUF1501 domain-containing protein [Planctomycetaceae bacterium]
MSGSTDASNDVLPEKNRFSGGNDRWKFDADIARSDHGARGADRTRRRFLWDAGAGFTGIALSTLLAEDGLLPSAGAMQPSDAAERLPAGLQVHGPLLPHRAKRCIFLYMYGGPSQMDLFDYKPELQKRSGQTVQIELRRRDVREGRLLGSQRRFLQHGQSGLWCSDALPHLAKHMDKLAVIKSLYQDSFAHGSANLQMNCGRILQGYPSLGSWLNYGLGSDNRNLPGFVVMLDPRGGPIPGAPNWGAGFMEAAHQGTVFRTLGEPILDLKPFTADSLAAQRRQLEMLQALESEYIASHSGYSELAARVAAYELAFQLQFTAPEALDVSQETQATQEMYGLFDPVPDHRLSIGPAVFGRQCLIARRLMERGVRFVQIYSGGGHQQQNWDAHFGVEENLAIHGPEIDRPIAALLTDLERRGLLDETLVVWGGEFGRQPVSQGDKGGRDHNPKGFTYWLAGGGVRGGMSYGETDELGAEAAVNRRHVRDLHATILRLMGFDHHLLTYAYGGLDHKLTGVLDAAPISEIIA